MSDLRSEHHLSWTWKTQGQFNLTSKKRKERSSKRKRRVEATAITRRERGRFREVPTIAFGGGGQIGIIGFWLAVGGNPKSVQSGVTIPPRTVPARYQILFRGTSRLQYCSSRVQLSTITITITDWLTNGLTGLTLESLSTLLELTANYVCKLCMLILLLIVCHSCTLPQVHTIVPTHILFPSSLPSLRYKDLVSGQAPVRLACAVSSSFSVFFFSFFFYLIHPPASPPNKRSRAVLAYH